MDEEGNLNTNEDIKNALEMFDDDDVPDGAYWGMVADALGCEIGDVWDAIASDPAFFGYGPPNKEESP